MSRIFANYDQIKMQNNNLMLSFWRPKLQEVLGVLEFLRYHWKLEAHGTQFEQVLEHL